ncbi:MAG TPA: hypothetical protein PK950_02940 [Candidatus Paceibacterota bacterium]|nr:hypothetical protein [Candidatus Paceibacterota bacterium]
MVKDRINASEINKISREKPNIILLGTGTGESELFRKVSECIGKDPSVQLIKGVMIPPLHLEAEARHVQIADFDFLHKKVKYDYNEFSGIIVCEDDSDLDESDPARAFEIRMHAARVANFTTSMIYHHKTNRIRLALLIDPKYSGANLYQQSYLSVAQQLGMYEDWFGICNIALNNAKMSRRRYLKSLAPVHKKPLVSHDLHHVGGSFVTPK